MIYAVSSVCRDIKRLLKQIFTIYELNIYTNLTSLVIYYKV